MFTVIIFNITYAKKNKFSSAKVTIANENKDRFYY